MGTLQFKNNASTTLSGSINNSQTSITVGNAANFPVLTAGDYFYVTMYEIAGNPAVEINLEIVKVTGTSGNIWTVERGQDGTSARSRDGISTCYIEHRFTAASAQLMAQRDNNLSDLASASTARTNLGLGTMATQSAASVAITGGTISGVTIAGIDSSTTIQDNADSTKKVAFEVSGVATNTTRTLLIPNASGTIALTSDLTAGYQPLDSDLTAIAGLSANGLIARTGTGTVAVRAITQPAAGITVSDGDGVSGNPTLGLANDLAGVEAINTTGFVRRTAADTWSASAIADGDLPSALTGKTYNALTLTSAATGFSVAGGTASKTLTVSNSLTLAGTDGTTITFPATSGNIPLNNQEFFIGTTSVAINRASASLSLSGVSIDGSAGSATSATSATTATNLAAGVLGSLPYQSAVATTALLAPNTSTTRNFLRMTGTGTVGAAPAWDTVTKADVGLASVENTALSTWTGSTNIATLGTVTAGTWSANTIAIARGGTGATTAVAAFDALAPTTTLGDLIYHDGTDNIRLAGNTTTSRRFLRQTGNGTTSAAPAWDGLQDGDVPATLTGKTYNGLSLTAAAAGFTVAGGTSSKTLTVSNTLTLAGTDASTLNIGGGGTLGSAAYTATTAYAPSAGSTSITTVGTIGSGTWQGSAIGISYGGTGATSKSAGYNALTPITTLGDLVYGDGANSATRLAGNTTSSKRFLTQTGTGTVSAAPGWNAIIDGDIPSALTGKTYNGLSLTANATGFQIAGGTTSKTLAVSNNITLSGTDGSTLNIGGGGTLGSAAYTASSAYQPIDADLSAIAALVGTSGFLKKTATDTWALDTNTYLTGNQSISISGDASGSGATSISLTLANSGATAGTYTKVTVDAKGRVTTGASLASADLPTYTGTITSSQVTTALGYTPYNSTNPSGYISGINSSMVTTALGYTPYSSANPNGYITSSASISGNAATATTLSTDASNWAANGVLTAVVGQLAWRNYSNGHTIFDASAGLAPNGASVNSTNAAVAWSATYPNLMGWNGSSTYGLRVDSSRIADSANAVAWSNVSGKPTTLSGFGITDGLTSATAASTYQTQSGMSAYLTTASASATYQTQSGMSSYLTTASASSTYAPLASPTLTGVPAAPTAAVDTNTTQIATTAYVVGQGYLKSSTASSTYLPLAGGNVTGNLGLNVSPTVRLDVNGNQASNIVAVAALNIDCSSGNYFTKTINGNSTFTVSNVPASRAYAFTLELTHTSGTVTWFAGVQWPNQTTPTLTIGRTHLFTFVTDDGGTRWRGVSNTNYTT